MTNGNPASEPDFEAASTEDSRRRLFRIRIIVMVALAGVLGILGAVLLPALLDPGGRAMPPGGTRPAVMATAPAASSTTASPSPAAPDTLAVPPVPAGPPAAPPQRLVYPAAGIDVPVFPLDPSSSDVASQTIVPPATMDGYWLTPYGMPGADSSNTTYVVGHSWQDIEAPFNRLSTNAAAGDRLTVTTSAGTLEYQVDSVTTYVKSGLKDSPIWEVAPNRLVLISCYTDDLWGTNVVVVASPAQG
ncbi:sortase family protein, LPXTG-site transpeptidase [Pseudarthrobacter phenanthrenivorans Sphe3]|uniref:Sortase family protein, LPXTG-site transpeptidase n=1 Tax=Pseudarthrobacter phenanthrenivorans (strain DSM 18606 / JCM 16027 / LMG 23796 / Sphe3) TaxID=930171 RepID=F0M5T6_PSEPM|nr:class F sortase [Pseudarthrobacter phenanthrenivorans]ADX73531.1 sortase family protein, LPXTG-site transpeptidase [Pseudarthrobacter phenanthrenivorans Sphe3]